MTVRLARRRRRTRPHGLARPACRVTRDGSRLVTWFKVDDSFHSHPKVLATSLAARGLWVTAGSWSSKHLTDGVLRDQELAALGGTPELAAELVAAGLWRRAKGGYRFHEWDADADGTVRNPLRSEVMAERRKKSSGGRIGNHRRWHASRGVTDPDCPFCQEKRASDTDRTSDRSTESGASPPVPSRPDPKGQSPSGFDPREVTQSSSVSVGDARATLTDDDLKIDQTIIGLLAELTGRTVSPNHAAGVRRQILGGRAVDKPLPYVARAIRERPKDFLPAAPAAERCPIHHLEQPCRSCAADRLAGDP